MLIVVIVIVYYNFVSIKNNNYLMKNTCCDCVKYCLLCLDNIANDKKSCEETIINQKTGLSRT